MVCSMNAIELEENGFKTFPCKHYKPYADRGFQKRYTDTKGIKYFIEIYKYSFENRTSYSPEVYLHTPKSDILVEIREGLSIKELEDFVENLWVILKCSYYEEWDE